MKYIFTLVLCCFFYCGLSQEKFNAAFIFKTDNDLYASKSKDRYYTSGVFLKYRYLSKNENPKLEKRILEWQIGHKMYTPSNATVPNKLFHDRPFAGYLYGSFAIDQVYKNKQILNTTLQIGVLGPNAFGKELQNFIHDIYGFKKAVGWKHQIKNAFAINFNASYSKELAKDKRNYFDISWINAGKIGTVFTNLSSGFYTRMGFKPLQSIVNSIAFNTNLNNDNTSFERKREAFVYVKTTFNYTLYDATLQGSFLNTGSEVTKELKPFHFGVEIGLQFTMNRFYIGYAYLYHGEKSKGLKYTGGNYYGSISLNYLFR